MKVLKEINFSNEIDEDVFIVFNDDELKKIDKLFIEVIMYNLKNCGFNVALMKINSPCIIFKNKTANLSFDKIKFSEIYKNAMRIKWEH